jgi:hypothetical protein
MGGTAIDRNLGRIQGRRAFISSKKAIVSKLEASGHASATLTAQALVAEQAMGGVLAERQAAPDQRRLWLMWPHLHAELLGVAVAC